MMHIISDHYPVFVILPQLVQFDGAHNLNNSNYPVQFFRPLNKGTIDRLNFNLEKESLEFIISDTTVNDDYEKIISVIQIAVNKHVPIVKCNSKRLNITKAWMIAGLLKSIRKKGKLYKMAQTGKLSWESYKEYKNKLNKLIKTRKQLYYSGIINRHRKDARVMWQIINTNINGGSKCNRDNFLSFNNVDYLNDYFVNLGSNAIKNIKSQGSFKQYLNNRIVDSLFIEAILPQEIINVTNILKPKLSCGHDGLSVKLIKSIINTIAVPSAKIFIKSFISGIFPHALKIARIAPVFKIRR